MERPLLEGVEDALLFDEQVVTLLIDTVNADEVPESTEELNDILRQKVGYGNLIPVVTGDSYEDIVMWLSRIELTEAMHDRLLGWTEDWYQEHQEDEVDTTNPTFKALTSIFCGARVTRLGKHYIDFLHDVSIRSRKIEYPYIKHVATKVCNRSLEDLYSILEGLDLIDVLAYDNDYPLKKRTYALGVAAVSLCKDPWGSYGDDDIDKLVACLAIVHAERMYDDPAEKKDKVGKIIAHYFSYYEGGRVGKPTSKHATNFVLDVLGYFSKTDELAIYFKDSIKLSLLILKQIYGVNVAKMMLRDRPQAYRGRRLLFDSL